MDFNNLSDNAKRFYNRIKEENIPASHKAYLMATAKHETGGTFLPIGERGSDTYLSKYWTNTKLRRWLGNLYSTDAQKYKGRGFVQITGRALYAKASKVVGVDLVTYPDKAFDYEIAFKIMVVMSENGMFTGVKLSNYLKEKETDFYTARRVINGLDKAALIESYAIEYQKIFQ